MLVLQVRGSMTFASMSSIEEQITKELTAAGLLQDSKKYQKHAGMGRSTWKCPLPMMCNCAKRPSNGNLDSKDETPDERALRREQEPLNENVCDPLMLIDVVKVEKPINS